jgi:hypothetical protein
VSPAREVRFEKGRREHYYDPNERVAERSPEKSPRSRVDDLSEEDRGERLPAQRIAPRDLKRRLWFQKKKLERRAARGSGGVKGKGKGRGKSGQKSRSPTPRR